MNVLIWSIYLNVRNRIQIPNYDPSNLSANYANYHEFLYLSTPCDSFQLESGQNLMVNALDEVFSLRRKLNFILAMERVIN